MRVVLFARIEEPLMRKFRVKCGVLNLSAQDGAVAALEAWCGGSSGPAVRKGAEASPSGAALSGAPEPPVLSEEPALAAEGAVVRPSAAPSTPRPAPRSSRRAAGAGMKVCEHRIPLDKFCKTCGA